MRRKGSFGKKPKLTCRQSVRFTNSEAIKIMLIAGYTHHTVSQIIRKYIIDGLVHDAALLEKIKEHPKYNIYLNNFLKDKSKSKQADKLGAHLSAIPQAEDERELSYLSFLEGQVSGGSASNAIVERSAHTLKAQRVEEPHMTQPLVSRELAQKLMISEVKK